MIPFSRGILVTFDNIVLFWHRINGSFGRLYWYRINGSFSFLYVLE